MSIPFTCPHCAEAFPLDDSMAGATVRCHACNRPSAIPAGASRAAPQHAWGLQSAPPAAQPSWQAPPLPAVPGRQEWQPPPGYPYGASSNPLPWILVGILAFILIAIAGMGMLWWAWDMAADDVDMHGGDVHVHIADDLPFDVEKPIRNMDFEVPGVPEFPMLDIKVPDINPAFDPLDIDHIHIALAQGRFEADHRLTDLEPIDPIRNQPRKVYTVDLKADRRYVMEMTSKTVECYLRVENAQGLPLDVGAPMKRECRLVFNPGQTARYRIVASRFAGSGDYHLSIRDEP